jgi:hypothetical protein
LEIVRELAMSRDRWPGQKSRAKVPSGPKRPVEVPIQLDLLRADLYRLLDELARSGPRERRELLAEFERAWAQLKRALGLGEPDR